MGRHPRWESHYQKLDAPERRADVFGCEGMSERSIESATSQRSQEGHRALKLPTGAGSLEACQNALPAGGMRALPGWPKRPKLLTIAVAVASA